MFKRSLMSWIADVPGIADEDVPVLTKHESIFDWVLGAWGGVAVNLVGEEQMRRCGVSEGIVRMVQDGDRAKLNDHPEVIWDSKPLTEYENFIQFEENSSGLSDVFCREEMHIRNKAFEFKDGYLALGSFYPGSFEGRTAPMARSFLDGLHQNQDELAEDDSVVCIPNGPIVEELVTTHMPWLKQALSSIPGWDSDDASVSLYLVVDSDYNAIILRQVRRDEIDRLAPGFEVPCQEGEECMIPIVAVAPSMGVTMHTTPGCIVDVPDWARFSPVSVAYIYKERRPAELRHLEVPSRDGSFTPASYLLYENPVDEGGTLRLPVAWANTFEHRAFTPRFDLDRKLIADLDWITFFTQEEDDAAFITVDEAKDAGIVNLQVGFWAELDAGTNMWKHTAVDAHRYEGNSIVSYTLELDAEETREHKMQVYALGEQICRIDLETRELNLGVLTRGEAVVAAIKKKVHAVLGTNMEVTFDNTGQSGMSTITEHLQYGRYPEFMYPINYPDRVQSLWGGNYTTVQIRWHQHYMAAHAELLARVTHDSELAVEQFKKTQKNLENHAEVTKLAKWTRQEHREKEAKRFAKLLKRECIPQAKEFLAHWDDWLRKQVAKWPENEASLENDWGEDVIDLIAKQHATGGWKRIRDGMAFWEFARDMRKPYSKHCTAEEWRRSVEEAVARDLQKAEEERLAASREARKQKELEAKLKKKVAADKERAKAERDAHRAAEQAKNDAERDAALAAIRARSAASSALMDAYANSDGEYETFEEYKATKAREAAAAEKARLDALAAEKAAANERRNKEARAAKEAEKAAHAAEREARRKKEEAEKAEAKRASQAATVIDRAKSGQAKKKESREVARQRDEGGGPPRRGRDADAGASSGADAARAAIEDVPRRGKKGGLGKGR